MYKCIEEIAQESAGRNKGFDSSEKGRNALNEKASMPYAGTQKAVNNAKGARYSNNGAIASPLS